MLEFVDFDIRAIQPLAQYVGGMLAQAAGLNGDGRSTAENENGRVIDDLIDAPIASGGNANRSQSVFDFIIGIHPGLSRKDIGYFTDSKGKRMQVTAAERDDKHLELIKLSNNLFAVN